MTSGTERRLSRDQLARIREYNEYAKAYEAKGTARDECEVALDALLRELGVVVYGARPPSGGRSGFDSRPILQTQTETT